MTERIHAIVFDVDGTLTQSSEVDARCFEMAVFEELGIRIDTDWSTYRHSTDEGILSELLDRHGLVGSSEVKAAVRTGFIDLLTAALRADATSCRATPGARALLTDLVKVPDVAVAIATGGWEESARLKLRHACIESDHMAFASSDDSPSRQEIIRIALERVAGHGISEFETVTYVGDAPWDVRAARELGIDFVGIAATAEGRAGLESAGAEVVLSSFDDCMRSSLLYRKLFA